MSRPATGRKILGLLREELPALSAGTVLLVAGAALSLVYPQGIRAIVDGALSGRDPARVGRIALLLAGLAVLQGAAIFGRHLLFSLAGERGDGVAEDHRDLGRDQVLERRAVGPEP